MKTIEILSKYNQNATLKPNTCECIKINLIYLPNKTLPMMFSIANIAEHKNRKKVIKKLKTYNYMTPSIHL